MLAKLLSFFNVTDENEKISLTNLIVIVFCAIVAFRTLFAGVDFNLKIVTWHVKDLDLASIIPMMLGLLNYGHRRMIQADTINKTTTPETK